MNNSNNYNNLKLRIEFNNKKTISLIKIKKIKKTRKI